MIFEHSSENKKKLLLIFLAFLFIGIFISLYSPIIFQERNPWQQIKGIVQLNFGNTNIIKLSDSKDVYMTKSSDGKEIIKNFMKDKGYEFTEQMGSGYLFKSLTNESAIVVHKYYSRYYSLWSINENTWNEIADELEDCLPKSDMASHEKCTNLLQKISGFADCVNAGFSIMKSNPPQCATPDGRIFFQSWN